MVVLYGTVSYALPIQNDAAATSQPAQQAVQAQPQVAGRADAVLERQEQKLNVKQEKEQQYGEEQPPVQNSVSPVADKIEKKLAGSEEGAGNSNGGAAAENTENENSAGPSQSPVADGTGVSKNSPQASAGQLRQAGILRMKNRRHLQLIQARLRLLQVPQTRLRLRRWRKQRLRRWPYRSL
jgi:hypothetical protein